MSFEKVNKIKVSSNVLYIKSLKVTCKELQFCVITINGLPIVISGC